MKIGIPKERKDKEYRVGITPAGVAVLVNNGHSILIEKNAGKGSGFRDVEYIKSGAKIIDSPAVISSTT